MGDYMSLGTTSKQQVRREIDIEGLAEYCSSQCAKLEIKRKF